MKQEKMVDFGLSLTYFEENLLKKASLYISQKL